MTKSRAKERCSTCLNTYHAGKVGNRLCPYCSGAKPMPAREIRKKKY